MATVIDITTKIKQEDKFVKIGEHSYKVHDDKNSMMEVMAVYDSATSDGRNEVQAMDSAITILLGKDAMKEIESMKLSFPNYKIVFLAVFAAASDLTYEEAEARFQGQ